MNIVIALLGFGLQVVIQTLVGLVKEHGGYTFTTL
jgi:hypothetical protein